jgi:hypothetical protein
MRRLLSRGVFLALILSQSAPMFAQPKPAATAVPPQFPTLTSPTWLGIGKADEHTLSGTNLADTNKILVSTMGVKATIVEGSAKADRVNVKFETIAETPVGLYHLRAVTKNGVTNFRPLTVDDLPFVEKKPGNNKKTSPMLLTVPCVVAGTVAVETSDFYLVKVVAGQRITFEALARRIGSPLDPVLILHDAKTGRELPTLYADDTPGLQSDARITHTFPAASEVLVEIRDTTYRGGSDFAYRLRVGDFPGCTTAFPLAIERDKTTDVNFTGSNLEGVLPVKLKGQGASMLVAPKRAGGPSGWSVPVLVSDYPELVEQEPNNSIEKANKLPLPGGVSAKFAEKNDVDHFSISCKKGQKFEVIAQTYEVNSATELLLRVLDSKGAELAKSDPTRPNARVEFTPAADGEFIVAAEHLNYAFGPSEVYHLTVQLALPDFELLVGADRVDLSAGGIAQLPIVGFTKKNGFNLPIELTVDSPQLTGSLTIPAAANPQPATPLLLNLKAKADAKPGPIPFRLRATAKIEGKDVVRMATIATVVREGLAGLPNIPPSFANELYAFTAEQPLFEVKIAWEKPEVAKAAALKGKITAKRAAGFAEEIAMTAANLPANVTAKLKPIAKGTNEVDIELNPAANATVGDATFYFRATAKNAGKDQAYNSDLTTVKIVEPKKEEPKKDEKKKDEPKKDEKKK